MARRLRLMVVSGVVGLLGLAPPASSAQVPIQVILPIGGFFDIVVDDSHQHVFVTGDPALNNLRVVAVDYRGNVVKLFRDEPGAAGMALDAGHSTLYVALQQGDAIAAIDTATLREKDRFSLGTEAGCPGYATFISGRVWFGFTCGTGTHVVGIGSLDPASGAVRTFGGSNYPSEQPDVRSSPALTDTLFASPRWPGGGDTIYKYRINVDGSLTFLASRHAGGDSISDLRVTADGLDVLASGCVGNYYIPSFRTSDLGPDQLYDNSCPAWAIAVTDDGQTVATVHFDCGQSLIFMHHRHSEDTYKAIVINIPPTFIYYGGMAFNQDASRLFTVGEEPSSNAAYFTIYPSPTFGTNARKPDHDMTSMVGSP